MVPNGAIHAFMRMLNKYPLLRGRTLSMILCQAALLIHAQPSNLPVRTDDITFEHLGEQVGINSYISCVFEDHLGFLWFGAGPEGVYRFDGYEFKHYEFISEDTTSLPHNIVADIKYEDHHGNLWLLSGGLLTRYNRVTNNFSRFSGAIYDLGLDTWANALFVSEDGNGKVWLGSLGNIENPGSGGLIGVDPGTDSFILLQHDPADSTSLSHNCVTHLFTDSNGNLWIGTRRGGVDRYVPGKGDQPGYFAHYRKRMKDPLDSMGTAINAISEDQQGTLWVGTGKGVLRLDREKNLFDRYLLHPDPDHLANKIHNFSQHPGGDLWIGTAGGVAVFDPNTNEITLYEHDRTDSFSVAPGLVKNIVHSENGPTWFFTDEGTGVRSIQRYDPVNGHFHQFRHQKADPGSLSQSQLTDALIDRTGILWVTTAGGGINKFDPHRIQIRLLNDIQVDLEYEWPGPFLALYLDQQDRLWIGTNGNGLYSYDRKSGIIKHYPYDAENPARGPRSMKIWDVVEQPEGVLWIGGDSGLNRLDTESMTFDHFWIDPGRHNYFGPNYIRQISARTPEKIWIATMGGGLISFDVNTKIFHSHLRSDANPGGVPPYKLMSLYEDDKGTVWTGTLGGLHRLIPSNGNRPDSCIHFWHIQGDHNSIGSNMVGDLQMDEDGTLWAATGGGGLNRIDPETGSVTRYTKREGLISNTITTIAMGHYGELWIGSNDGLGRFDPKTGKCFTFNRNDGLPSLEITQGTTCQSANGEIFMAGPGGIFSFHPESYYNDHVPQVALTGIYLFDQPLAVNTDRVLELKHDENFISFEFISFNYSNSNSNQYRYRMVGLDPDTVDAGNRRTANYTGMKPGRYTFWFTGSNNVGVWNQTGSSLDILIHPPWRRTGLAIGMYILIFVLGILGIIRWRTWKLLNDRRILERQVKERTRVIEEKDRHILEMDRMKTRFFANISHEFRTPLTLILNPLDELMSRRRPADPEYRKLSVIRRNGQRMLHLVNQLLDLSKLDSGKLKLELKKADVVQTLRLTFASFISLAEKNKIKYSYHLPDGEWHVYFDAGKLETILNNLLSNAFKFTPLGGIIECYARIEEVYTLEGKEQGPIQLTVSVIDSGPGIASDQLKQIFNRFFQGDKQYHSEIGGTGIGLALTKELVDLVHGEITVNSEPGEGSCFMVAIPLGHNHLKESEYVLQEETKDVSEIMKESIPWDRDEKEESPEKENHDHDPLPPARHLHLLVVEDNDDLRSYLKDQLQREYTLVEASTGTEGLKKALQVIPDLIITDVMMPGIDGVELCRRLKTNESTSHIPVIMLTAKADFNSRIEGLETGADDYILKPFQIKELRTRVDNLIRQRNMLRERFSRNVDILTEDYHLNSYDVKFIRRVTEVVENHLSDFEFDVKHLQAKTGMSNTQLYRKLNALTGRSPSRFIRYLRLKRASKMLQQQKGSITHVAFEVGFGNLSYFTKCFREEFGISPSEYSRQYM